MNAFLTLAEEIRELVKKDKLAEALSRLGNSLQDLPELDTVILQQGRLSALRKDIMEGTAYAEQVGKERNQIRVNLLDLVRELEKQGKAQTQVFISYSQEGAGVELAKQLHDSIEEAGFVAFLDTEDIQTGEDWVEFVLSSLRASDYFVLLLSEKANTSEMVIKEVMEARNLQSLYGKPVILPVRVQWPENTPLHPKLSKWLNRIQQQRWDGPEDSEQVITKLLNVISERGTLRRTEKVSKEEVEDFAEGIDTLPLTDAPLEIPQGSVHLASPFYVTRKGEVSFIKKITAPKALLRIRGPRQYGKTSLLSRVVAHAREQQYEVVTMDFQNFSEPTLQHEGNLIWEFCWKIAAKVDKEDEFEDYWDAKLKRKPDRDKKQIAHTFIERQVLENLSTNLLVAIDEADRIFPYEAVSDDFFLMLRSWHEGANTNSLWEKFKLALSYSTEAKLAIKNLNASPFNVGEEARLHPFTLEQLTNLSEIHGLSLSRDQLDKLLHFLGGQPYLSRRALFSLANHEYTFDGLLEEAASDQGPFSDHLRHHLFNLKQFPDLAKAMKNIITSGKCGNPIEANRLGAAGLTEGTPPNDVRIVCELYKVYFKSKL